MMRGPRGPPRRQMERMKISKINPKDLRFITQYLGRYKTGFVLTVIFTCLPALITIIPPLIMQQLIDVEIVNGNVETIILLTSALILIYGLIWLVTYLQIRFSSKTSHAVVADMRTDVFSQFMHLPLSYHTDQRRGELLSVVSNDVNNLSDAFTSRLVGLISDLISIIGILAVMFWISPKLALITLIIVPLLVITIRLLRGRIRSAAYNVRERIADLNANVEESLSGIREIQSFAVEKRNKSNFANLTQQNMDANIKASMLMAIFGGVVSLNSSIGIAVVIGVGGFGVINGTVTLGVMIAFMQYITHLIQPISELSTVITTFQTAAASLVHITEYMQVKNAVPESDNPVVLPDQIHGDLSLENVVFGYGRFARIGSTSKDAETYDEDEKNDIPLFSGLNLEVKSGEKVGIVGETGAGKSTLISLVTRLYDVWDGAVKLDGIDVRNISNKDLRSNLAMVSQRVVLFSDTVANNVKFSKPDATDEEVIEAAKMANAHQFISKMPEGYQTQIGEGGSRLSGGQKQLISYARLMLVRPKVVILDEATSNIDSYTEELIQKNMNETLSGITTLIIAHRFATLKSADRLVVMKDGKVRDIGTHQELMANNDYYRELCEKQYSKM